MKLFIDTSMCVLVPRLLSAGTLKQKMAYLAEHAQALACSASAGILAFNQAVRQCTVVV
ncbi:MULTISPECIES: hypothetical protein [unclassified Pseudomonas]|uniref:hypothetical protein n=1 Tax=unclassified Pseudomonas TaxID=196821 RepID=UPI0023E03845|nr:MULTISPECIES: hypothetical protein [unclassified Pseudomonas]MDF3196189.1 hypothetical protein [Pseudomonas sp. 1928-m]MDP2747717.1 hypothetical protein [Pseudomonas sp.]MDZ4338343.1 hypothetical protein [Pseudomonas sp.]